MVGTIPGDVAQFYVHAFRVMQKVAYLYGWQSFLDEVEDVDDAALVERLLQQVYGDEEAAGAAVPREVLVPVLPPDPDEVQAWLSGLRGSTGAGAANRRVRLVEYAIDTLLISANDLPKLRAEAMANAAVRRGRSEGAER